MQIVAWPGVCAVEVPNRWSWETSHRVISIFRSDGTGVVQIQILPSTADRELIDAELSSLPSGDSVSSAAPVGLMSGQTSTRDAVGRRWVIWAAQGARDHRTAPIERMNRPRGRATAAGHPRATLPVRSAAF